MKYKKGSRAVCTLYPEEGYFICMVSVGAKEAPEAELALNGCTAYVRQLYHDTTPFNGEMDDDRGKERGSAGGCEGADWDSDEEETECLSLNNSVKQ